jgi:hypothetical protein
LYKHTNIDYSPLLADSIISDKTCSFKGDYIQEEGVGLKRYGWRLTNSQDNRVIIDTISNNNIYGIKENILCSYNGFLDDSQYSIELYVETQNGYCVTTESIDFSVEYETSYVTSDFRVECLPDEPSIMLNWQNTVAIQGRVEGTVNYINNFPIIGNSESHSVEIPQGTSVIWDYGASSSLDIPEDCYIVLSTQISSIKNTILFYAEGVDDNGYKIMRKLSFEVIDQGTKGRFVYDVLSGDGNLFTKYYTPEDNYQPSDYTWYIITMEPEIKGELALQVVPSIAINGLYPNSTSYPNADTYPRYGVWDKLNSSEGGEV